VVGFEVVIGAVTYVLCRIVCFALLPFKTFFYVVRL
jgi:hypothetical protein